MAYIDELSDARRSLCAEIGRLICEFEGRHPTAWVQGVDVFRIDVRSAGDEAEAIPVLEHVDVEVRIT